MVVHQHEAAQFGTKMAIDPRRQRGQDGASIRRDPTLALIAGGTGRNYQILHQKRLVAPEARAFGDRRGFHYPVFDADPRRHLAPATRRHLEGRLRRLRALVHAARFERGAALQAFQTGDLFALLADHLFQVGDFAKQFDHQSFELRTAQIRDGGGQRHIRKDVCPVEPDKQKVRGCRRFCPSYIRQSEARFRRLSCIEFYSIRWLSTESGNGAGSFACSTAWIRGALPTWWSICRTASWSRARWRKSPRRATSCPTSTASVPPCGRRAAWSSTSRTPSTPRRS